MFHKYFSKLAEIFVKYLVLISNKCCFELSIHQRMYKSFHKNMKQYFDNIHNCFLIIRSSC